MSVLTGFTFLDFASIFAVIITTLIIAVKYNYSFWKRRGLQYVPEPTFPFGNIKECVMQKLSPGEVMKNHYDEFVRRGYSIGGIFQFTKPSLVVADPELLKNILTRDFDHFHDRGTYCNENKDPLTGHLVHLGGAKWKNMRAKLTPTFTSGKLKNMYPILLGISQHLDKLIEEESTTGKALGIKSLLGRYTADVIVTCAFGIDCNSLKDVNTPFFTIAKRVFERKSLKLFFSRVFPKAFSAMNLKCFDENDEQFFLDVVKKTIAYRKENNVSRNDLLQLLMHMMEGTGENSGMSFNEIAAQAFSFFLASYDSSSTAMSFALYELAENQDIQDKLRGEIQKAILKHGGITYDSLADMPYLDKVLCETLRKYPPFPMNQRICTKEYTMEGSNMVIPEGMLLVIPILGFHRDPQYYPEPEKFDPERFTEENKNTRHAYSYIPFGGGPRICIGMRFAQVQAKTGLVHLLSKYKFTVSEKNKLPFVFETDTIATTVKGDVFLNAQRL